MLVEFIKECRQKKAWRQSEMALHMGISTQAISNIERKVMKPPIQFLVRFCQVFDIDEETVQDLFVSYQREIAAKESMEKWRKATLSKAVVMDNKNRPALWN